MHWQPEHASSEIEEAMESCKLTEHDRDEVRRFAEFLKRLKDHKENKKLEPVPNGI